MAFKRRWSLIVILILASAFTTNAANRGTAEEAKSLLKKAVEHYQQVGRKEALQDFTGKKTPWVDRDLYVGCMDSKHILTANGAFPSYVGNSLDAAKDENGKPLGQAFWEAASNGGVGTVKWKWFNPVTGKLEPKVAFVQKVDEDMTCSVGYYPGQ